MSFTLQQSAIRMQPCPVHVRVREPSVHTHGDGAADHRRLGNNRLTSITAVGKVSKLRSLDVSHNRLVSLPETIGSLCKLTKLWAFSNLLESLPEAVGGLIALIKLDVSNNYLKSLPEAVGALPNLMELYADGNELNELPNAMRNLSRLYSLNVSSNRLDRLPDFVAETPELCDIDASFNKLRALPESWDSKNCPGEWLFVYVADLRPRPLPPGGAPNDCVAGACRTTSSRRCRQAWSARASTFCEPRSLRACMLAAFFPYALSLLAAMFRTTSFRGPSSRA